MISKHSLKKILLPVFIILLVAGILVVFYSPVIFQEGNPWPQIKGIAQLNFGNEDVVKLDIGENKYITKADNPEIIKSFMKGKGYDFTEQMGSGYLFKSGAGVSAVATHRYYSRYYSLWSITENIDNIPANNESWTTATDRGITFQYPQELAAKYISEAEWPPIIKIEPGTYSCNATPLEISSVSEITSQRLVDDRIYCVNVKHEGAAGSVYSSYIYTTAKDGKLITVSFTLRYPNCSNYDDDQNKICTSEREAFDVDAMIDRIIQTIKGDSSPNESLSAQIKKCIVMSDSLSHERCNELLKQINDYNSCVGAGFPIMKSNPPQCATPDGRTFVQDSY